MAAILSLTMVWWLCKELNTGSLGTFVWTRALLHTNTPKFVAWAADANKSCNIRTNMLRYWRFSSWDAEPLKPNESKCHEPNKHQPTGVNSYMCRLTKFVVPMKKWFPGSQIHILVFDFPSHKLAIYNIMPLSLVPCFLSLLVWRIPAPIACRPCHHRNTNQKPAQRRTWQRIKR